MKKCSHCKELRELEEFNKDKWENDGRCHRCRKCVKEIKAKSYIKNIANESLPTRRYQYGINKAKFKQLDWDIKIEQYLDLIKLPCYYCNKDISKEMGVGLDRLNNNMGYLLTNVVTCCGNCNSSRMDRFTHEEWKVAMTALSEYRKLKMLL